MATGESYANQAGTVTAFAYVYVEDSSGGFKRMTKEQFISLVSGSVSGYTLPTATEDALGGIKAEAKTDTDTVVVKIGEDGKLYVPTYPVVPSSLKNPNALTIKQGDETITYDGSGALTITIPDAGTVRVEKGSTDTTVELEPNKLYIFPEMESLELTLADPDDTSIVNEYHVMFQSGATATTLTLPDTINTGSLTIEASKVYELSIMENMLTFQSWAVS